MVELVDEKVGALLSVGVEVDVCEVVALQALGPPTLSGSKMESGRGPTADVDHVGRYPGGGVHGGVVGQRDLRQQKTPVVLLFVADHGEHLGQAMVDPPDAAVGTGVVGAGIDLIAITRRVIEVATIPQHGLTVGAVADSTLGVGGSLAKSYKVQTTAPLGVTLGWVRNQLHFFCLRCAPANTYLYCRTPTQCPRLS